MGKTKPLSEHVKQISIGIRLDQCEWLNNTEDGRNFRKGLAQFIRLTIDERIEVINNEKTN